jgi:5-methylcytosine-specific restriction endonuclease McrA
VLWQADHVRPVSDGGGETPITNYRLLCPVCHGGVTHALMQDRKARATAPSPWAAAAREAREYKQPLPHVRRTRS